MYQQNPDNDVVIQVSMITTFIHNNPNWQFQTRWLENLKLVKFIEKTENDFELKIKPAPQ